jgi:hypothetical protein
MTKGIIKTFIGCAAALLLAVTANAELTLSGSTTGTVTGVPELVFSGNPGFTGTTQNNFGSLSGLNSLGSFFLNTGGPSLVTGTFVLDITFTAPTGITGGQSQLFNAMITGSVSNVPNQGGIAINFTNSSQTFTFSGNGGGSFTLTVPNLLFVQTDRSADLTAGFTAAVPEPATATLLATGLLGGGILALRKRRA